MWTNDPQFSAAAEMRDRVRSIYAVASILMTAGFFYASAVPLVFAVPDFQARMAAALTPRFWDSQRLSDSEQGLDWIVNLLALVPLGFFWSGTIADRPTNCPPDLRAFLQVALGCLIVATLAESLQFWLPRRVPSLRDLVALETGAILGCGLWGCAGERITAVCCVILHRWEGLAPKAGFGRWLSLFCFLLGVCLTANLWASPADCFEMYRHRTFSVASGNAPAELNTAEALVSSVAAALVLCGMCGFAVRRVERYRLLRNGALSTNEIQVVAGESVPGSSRWITDVPAQTDRYASAAYERAA